MVKVQTRYLWVDMSLVYSSCRRKSLWRISVERVVRAWIRMRPCCNKFPASEIVMHYMLNARQSLEVELELME